MRTISGAASLLASLMLCVLAFLRRPDFAFSHAGILSGAQLLSEAQRESYFAYVRQNLTFDSVFLVLQIIVWCGLASVIFPRNRLIAAFVLVVGTLGVILDFSENSIRWIFLTLPGTPSESLAIAWSVIFSISFWLMAVAAMVASTALWSAKPIARCAVIAGLAAIPAAASTFSAGFKFLFVWLIVWHAVIGIFLLRDSDSTTAGGGTAGSCGLN